MLLPLHMNGLNLDSGTAVAVITGTASSGLTEAEIVTGGETIIITLTNDTWVAAGATFNAQRQNIIDGLDSAQSEATGWNAEVRDNEVVTAVVRTSDTVVTITLSAAAAYDVTADETITVTVPATALVTSATELTATPTIAVTADVEEDEEQPSGGYGIRNAYDAYRQRKRKRKRDIKQLREQLSKIDKPVDREIGLLLLKQRHIAERQAEIDELEKMVVEFYSEREAKAMESERLKKAFVRAYMQRNYSAIEAFEREMERFREDEEFLMLAVTLLQ